VNVQVLVLGGDLNIEVVENGPSLAITLSPSRRAKAMNEGAGQPTQTKVRHSTFEPGMAAPFGWTPDN
jgi:hypothetical protein